VNNAEFEYEFKKFVKIQGSKFDDDKLEFMRWCFKRLKNLSINVVSEILETACGYSDYFPKIGDINKAVSAVMAKTKTASNVSDRGKTNFEWVIGLTSKEGRYYSHKLNDYEKRLLMDKMKKDGYTKFEDIETAPWWTDYHNAINLLKESFINKAHNEITNEIDNNPNWEVG
jgi:hypothetical protein